MVARPVSRGPYRAGLSGAAVTYEDAAAFRRTCLPARAGPWHDAGRGTAAPAPAPADRTTADMAEQGENPPGSPPPVGGGAPGAGDPPPAPGWGPAQPPTWATPSGYGAAPPPGFPPPGNPPPGGYPSPGFGPQYQGWAPPPQAPKPGIVPLRPLGVADILDGAVSYIRRDPRTVLGLSAALSLVLVALSFVANFAAFRSLSELTRADYSGADPTETALSGGSFGGDLTTVLAALLTVPISILATGLLTVVVGQAVLGRRVSARQAWQVARPRLLALVGLTLLLGLIVGGTATVGVLLAVGLGLLVGSATGVGVGVLVAIPVGLTGIVLAAFLAIRLLLSPVVLVLEKASILTAMRRSTRLVRGSWWRVFGISLLAQVIASVVAQVLTIPFTIGGVVLAVAFPSQGGLWWLALAAVSLGTFVASLVSMPFTAGVTALQYIDQRIRREALDLELVRAAAGH